MKKIAYVCINPACDSYLDKVKRSSDEKNPKCNECGEKLQKEE